MTLEQTYYWHLKTITDERHGLIATGSTVLQDMMLDLGNESGRSKGPAWICKGELNMAIKTATRRRETAPEIRTWDDPILLQICEPVQQGEDVTAIIRQMCMALRNSKTGVGLAAPQIGVAKRIIVIAPNGFYQEMINPEIVKRNTLTETKDEGCLSYPGRFVPVERHTLIAVKHDGRHGEKMIGAYDGFAARIIQHEIDHLNGICKVKP